ncbi:MAG: hypothetical protein WAM73_04690 [Desulfobacterales bacterium]
MKAFVDHGDIGALMPTDGGDHETVLDRIAKAGINTEALAVILQEEGTASFVNPWIELMAVIASKSATLTQARC